MAQRILRPLSYADMFDELFDLYKNNFLLFTGIVAIFYLPLNILVYGFGGIIVGGWILAALEILFNFIIVAATTWAVAQCYLGNKVTIREAYASIRGRIISLFALLFLSGLFILLGMALIVPGIMLAFSYAFVTEVFIIEHKCGRDAMRRSGLLARGNWWRIIAVSVVAGILVSAVSGLMTGLMQYALMRVSNGPIPAGPLGAIYGLVAGVSNVITTPVQVMALVLLYYDIRVRKEGFDVEMLAASLNAASPAPLEEAKPV